MTPCGDPILEGPPELVQGYLLNLGPLAQPGGGRQGKGFRRSGHLEAAALEPLGGLIQAGRQHAIQAGGSGHGRIDQHYLGRQQLLQQRLEQGVLIQS